MTHKHHHGDLNSGLGDAPSSDTFNFTSLLNGQAQGNLPAGVEDNLGPFGLEFLGDDSFDGNLLSNPLTLDPAPAHVDFRGLVTTRTTSTPNSTQIVNSSTPNIPGVTAHWDGITFAQSGGYYPPDNGFAVGAAVAIAAENDAIQMTTKTGLGALTESLSTFFAPVLATGYFLSDPRVLYDAAHHQFVVAVDEISNTLNASNVLLAVSTTDPTSPSLSSSGWQFEAVSTTHQINGVTTWSDQPLVSVDGNNIVISTNQFTSSGIYEGSMLTVLNDGLYGPGGTSTVASTTLLADPSYQPAAIAGGGEIFTSYIGDALSIFESTGGATTIPVTVNLGNIDFGNGSYSARQHGTTYQLDAGDGRVTSAAYDSTDHRLYVVFEVQPQQSAVSKLPSVEWVQLDMTDPSHPTVLNEGNLNALLPKTGATLGAATFNASVAVDGHGDVLFNFNVSGPNMLPADYYADWKGAGTAPSATTPLISTPVDYHDSVAAYIDPAHDKVGRWGDYSTAVADATNLNQNSFYVSNEFDNGTVSHYSSWGTATADIVV